MEKYRKKGSHINEKTLDTIAFPGLCAIMICGRLFPNNDVITRRDLLRYAYS
jgi:hypothetical protein